MSLFLRRLSAFQASDVGQGELWLVLTDPSLQEDKPERPRRRTLALCVSTSCVLTSSVVRALHSAAACCVSFRDVVKEEVSGLNVDLNRVTLTHYLDFFFFFCMLFPTHSNSPFYKTLQQLPRASRGICEVLRIRLNTPDY